MVVKKSEIVKAVVVRTVNHFVNESGLKICFDDNAVVIINNDGSPKGTLGLLVF